MFFIYSKKHSRKLLATIVGAIAAAAVGCGPVGEDAPGASDDARAAEALAETGNETDDAGAVTDLPEGHDGGVPGQDDDDGSGAGRPETTPERRSFQGAGQGARFGAPGMTSPPRRGRVIAAPDPLEDPVGHAPPR